MSSDNLLRDFMLNTISPIVHRSGSVIFHNSHSTHVNNRRTRSWEYLYANDNNVVDETQTGYNDIVEFDSENLSPKCKAIMEQSFVPADEVSIDGEDYLNKLKDSTENLGLKLERSINPSDIYYKNTSHDRITQRQGRKFYCREWIWEKMLQYLDIKDPCSVPEISSKHGVHSSTTHYTTNEPVTQVLAIVGGPGSGKTTICRRIVDECQRNALTKAEVNSTNSNFLCYQIGRRLIAYHSCDTLNRSSLVPARFVSSLRNQLIAEENPISFLFSDALQALEERLGSSMSSYDINCSPDDIYADVILSVLRTLSPNDVNTILNKNSYITDTDDVLIHGKSQSSIFDLKSRRYLAAKLNRFFILVDGIDEVCLPHPEDNRRQRRNSSGNSCKTHSRNILELLANHMHLFPDWLALVVTYRRQNRSMIKKFFPKIKNITIDDLRKPLIVHDVQGYLLSRFSQEQSLQNHLKVHPLQELLNLLRIKSSACILYLETILDWISECRMTPEEITLVPGTLNGLFFWLCQRIFTPVGLMEKLSKFDFVRPMLNLLLALPKPITDDQLFKLLSTINTDMTRADFNKQLQILQSLVVLQPSVPEVAFGQHTVPDEQLNKNHLTVQFFHPSFAEWLTDVKMCSPTFLCSMTEGRELLEYVRIERSDSFCLNDANEESNLIEVHKYLPHLQSTCSDSLERPDDLFFKSRSSDSRDLLSQSSNLRSGSKARGSEIDGYKLGFQSQPKVDRETLSHDLVQAARLGQYDQVKMLLESQANPNYVDTDGWSALRIASWRGHLNVVQTLLYYGADVNLAGSDNRTALRAASWAGHADIVHCLLDAGADVTKQDAEGRTPLIAAAYMGHVNVIEMLLQAGAEVNHIDEDGRTALHVASFCVQPSEMHAKSVACLLNYGANPNLPDNEGITSFLGSALAGNCTICEMCLEADADVNQTDRNGRSALMLGILGGHLDIVRLLLFWGAAVDVMDSAGRSLLSLAASIGNSQIVQELLARGLDEAHRDHSGRTPLHLAAMAIGPQDQIGENKLIEDEKFCEVIQNLLETGMNVEDTDNAGHTPLILACESNNIEAVKLLISHLLSLSRELGEGNNKALEADISYGYKQHMANSNHRLLSSSINKSSLDGQTPLRAAVFQGNTEMVKILLDAGADPDYQDAYGRTTLYLLALEGLLDMADLLLNTPAVITATRPGSSRFIGANPVLSDDEGRCPLHVATWMGRSDFVRLLLQAGTPVDIRDREGRTPLQLAGWQGFAEICRILIHEGHARVDAVCSQGATTLCIAAQEGHLEVCLVLLRAGANPLQTDAHGRTPYRVALKAGNIDICKVLESFPYNPNKPGPKYSPMSTTPTVASPNTNNTSIPNHPYHGHSTENDVPEFLGYPQPMLRKSSKYNLEESIRMAQQPISIQHHMLQDMGSKSMDNSMGHEMSSNLCHSSNSKPSNSYFDDKDPYARPPGPMVVGHLNPNLNDSSYPGQWTVWNAMESQSELPHIRTSPYHPHAPYIGHSRLVRQFDQNQTNNVWIAQTPIQLHGSKMPNPNMEPDLSVSKSSPLMPNCHVRWSRKDMQQFVRNHDPCYSQISNDISSYYPYHGDPNQPSAQSSTGSCLSSILSNPDGRLTSHLVNHRSGPTQHGRNHYPSTQKTVNDGNQTPVSNPSNARVHLNPKNLNQTPTLFPDLVPHSKQANTSTPLDYRESDMPPTHLTHDMYGFDEQIQPKDGHSDPEAIGDTNLKETKNSSPTKPKKIISTKSECFARFAHPRSHASSSFGPSNQSPNSEDSRGLFFGKSALAGVFGLGSRKNKRNPKPSVLKNSQPEKPDCKTDITQAQGDITKTTRFNPQYHEKSNLIQPGSLVSGNLCFGDRKSSKYQFATEKDHPDSSVNLDSLSSTTPVNSLLHSNTHLKQPSHLRSPISLIDNPVSSNRTKPDLHLPSDRFYHPHNKQLY